MSKSVALKPAYSELHRPDVTDEMLAGITARIVAAFRPLKVILFGSYASGSPHRDSDLDLMVIMDSDDSLHNRIVKVSEVARVPYLPMDILVRTPGEIAQRIELGDHFIQEIMSKGRVLYSHDAC
jgi:predicted nucleotidyltransferase